jgi:hypothetical protein
LADVRFGVPDIAPCPKSAGNGSEQLIGHRIGASLGFMVETGTAPRGADDGYDAVLKSFLRVSDIDQWVGNFGGHAVPSPSHFGSYR